jgi:hypothetical protein
MSREFVTFAYSMLTVQKAKYNRFYDALGTCMYACDYIHMYNQGSCIHMCMQITFVDEWSF